MKLRVPQHYDNKNKELDLLLQKAMRNIGEYEMVEFDWVREYYEAVIKYFEEVFEGIATGVALKLEVDPYNIHKSVKIPMMDLVKAANGEETDHSLFYKSLFHKLKDKYSKDLKGLKKFRFNKGKPIKPIQLKGRYFYNIETKKPMTNEDFSQLSKDVTEYLTGNIGNMEDETVVQAALLGKMMQVMEMQGIPIEKQKKMSWDEVDDSVGGIPRSLEEARDKFDLAEQEYHAIQFAKNHAAEYLSIEDGDIKKKIVNMVRKQITKGIEDGISKEEMVQRLYWMDPRDELGKEVNKDTLEELNRDWRRVALYEMNYALSNGYLAAQKAQVKKGEKIYFVFSGRYNPHEPPSGPNSCNQFLGKICLLVDEPVEDDTDTNDEFADYLIWPGKTNIGRGRDTWCAIPLHPNCTHTWVRIHPQIEEWDDELKKIVFKIEKSIPNFMTGEFDLIKAKKVNENQVIVDIDGTIFEYGKYKKNVFGKPKKDVTHALIEIKDKGYRIVLFTARKENERKALESHLEKHEIYYDELIMGKPIGKYYIDDRALEFKDNWLEIRDIIKSESPSGMTLIKSKRVWVNPFKKTRGHWRTINIVSHQMDEDHYISRKNNPKPANVGNELYVSGRYYNFRSDKPSDEMIEKLDELYKLKGRKGIHIEFEKETTIVSHDDLVRKLIDEKKVEGYSIDDEDRILHNGKKMQLTKENRENLGEKIRTTLLDEGIEYIYEKNGDKHHLIDLTNNMHNENNETIKQSKVILRKFNKQKNDFDSIDLLKETK